MGSDWMWPTRKASSSAALRTLARTLACVQGMRDGTCQHARGVTLYLSATVFDFLGWYAFRQSTKPRPNPGGRFRPTPIRSSRGPS